MSLTEKKKKSNAAWDKKATDMLAFKAPKGYRGMIDEAACNAQLSRNAWLIQLVRRELEAQGMAVEQRCRDARAQAEAQREPNKS